MVRNVQRILYTWAWKVFHTCAGATLYTAASTNAVSKSRVPGELSHWKL